MVTEETMKRSIIVLFAILLLTGLAFGKDIEVEDGVLCIYGDVVIPHELAPKVCLDANLQSIMFWDYADDPERYQATRMWIIDHRHEKIGFSEYYGPSDSRNDRTEGVLNAWNFTSTHNDIVTFSGHSPGGEVSDGTDGVFTGGGPGTLQGSGGGAKLVGAPGRGTGTPGVALVDSGLPEGTGPRVITYVGAFNALEVWLGHADAPVKLRGAAIIWQAEGDPDKPAEGETVVWAGEGGTEWCPDDAMCIAHTKSGVTKRDILHSWSSGSTWP